MIKLKEITELNTNSPEKISYDLIFNEDIDIHTRVFTHKTHSTISISTQLGAFLDYKYKNEKSNYVRNLETAEINLQINEAMKLCPDSKTINIMTLEEGEPLLNWKFFRSSIADYKDPKITFYINTFGIIYLEQVMNKIQQLTYDGHQIRLQFLLSDENDIKRYALLNNPQCGLIQLFHMSKLAKRFQYLTKVKAEFNYIVPPNIPERIKSGSSEEKFFIHYLSDNKMLASYSHDLNSYVTDETFPYIKQFSDTLSRKSEAKIETGVFSPYYHDSIRM